jgi:hypothetical protein
MDYGFTLDALALEPSGFGNDRVERIAFYLRHDLKAK